MVRTVMVDWSLLRQEQLSHRPKLKKKATVKAFIQARSGSKRLPNKIYENINGAPMLFHTIDAAKRSKLIDDVVVVSPHKLPELPEGVREFVYGGDESDVLGRYAAAARANPCNYIVRLTSDCPMLDPGLIDFVIAASIGYDYGSNVLVPTFPDGMDVEVISIEAMDWLDKNAKSDYDREHVTTKIRNDAATQIDMALVSVQAFQDQSYIKISVDTADDLERVRKMDKELRCVR